jgi:tetratricopeptide (TPR) repeat protein
MLMVLPLAALLSTMISYAPPSSQSSFDRLAQAAAHARDEHRDDAAIETYRQALKLNPEWDQGLWYLSTLLYEKEHYSEACELLPRFLAQHPQSAYGWALLGMSEFQTRQYSPALSHLQLGLALGFGDNRRLQSTVSYHTAILLTRFESFDDSMSLLFSLLTAGGTASSLVEPFGLAGLRMPLLPAEIPAERREMVRKAGSAVIALQEQRYLEAERLFGELETAYPDQPGVHFLIGAYLLGPRPDDGIGELQREIDISPSHVPARIRLAEEYIERQETARAISYARQALKLDPKNSLAHMVLGEGLVASGDTDGGIREMETARDSSPEMVRVRWDLVRAYIAKGRTEDANREKGAIEKLSKPDAAH